MGLTVPWILIGALATWRVTHLLHAEQGPWGILERYRTYLKQTLGTHLFDCFYCLSVWVALPVGLWLGQGWKERVLGVLAFSGAAVLLERVTHPGFDRASPVSGESAIPPVYFEGEDVDHELLQSKGAGGSGESGGTPN